MVSHEERRLTRLSTILTSVRACGACGASYAKIIAVAMVQFGCSKRTAREYVDTLILSEKIKVEKDLLFA